MTKNLVEVKVALIVEMARVIASFEMRPMKGQKPTCFALRRDIGTSHSARLA